MAVRQLVPLDKIRFYFSENDELGLPRASVAGFFVPIFDVPLHVCPTKTIHDVSARLGEILALIFMAWLRNFHRHAADNIDAPISTHPGFLCDLSAFIERQNTRRSSPVTTAFFVYLQGALEHAVTANGDPVHDLMDPAAFDALDAARAEALIRAALAGQDIDTGVFNFREPS